MGACAGVERALLGVAAAPGRPAAQQCSKRKPTGRARESEGGCVDALQPAGHGVAGCTASPPPPSPTPPHPHAPHTQVNAWWLLLCSTAGLYVSWLREQRAREGFARQLGSAGEPQLRRLRRRHPMYRSGRCGWVGGGGGGLQWGLPRGCISWAAQRRERCSAGMLGGWACADAGTPLACGPRSIPRNLHANGLGSFPARPNRPVWLFHAAPGTRIACACRRLPPSCTACAAAPLIAPCAPCSSLLCSHNRPVLLMAIELYALAAIIWESLRVALPGALLADAAGPAGGPAVAAAIGRPGLHAGGSGGGGSCSGSSNAARGAVAPPASLLLAVRRKPSGRLDTRCLLVSYYCPPLVSCSALLPLPSY